MVYKRRCRIVVHSVTNMVNYFIYANHFASSTDWVRYYHENALRTLDQFKSDVQQIKSELIDPEDIRIIYLNWGHKCEEVTEHAIINSHIMRFASGKNTLPETIIEWIKTNIASDKIKLMYLLTDGLIDSQSIKKCFELNQDTHYEKVVFLGFQKDLNYIDLSVAASFLKAHCTIYCNNELIDNVDISEAFDYDKITLDNFAIEIRNLKSYVKLKYINSSKKSATAHEEIDNLKKLRNRLFNDLSEENTNSSTKNNNLNTTDKHTFLSEFKSTKWYKNLTNPLYVLYVDIEKSVSALISYIVSENRSYAFDALKFDTEFRCEVYEEEKVDIVPDQEIEFPDVSLDDNNEIPVILCTELNLLDKLILNDFTKGRFSKFASMMDCPLFLLDDADLNESIGYFYTLNEYKELITMTEKFEPRTQQPFHGGLVLVDTDDFDKYNDYILSATYFNFKKVEYNVGLFYFVLWKICEGKQWMDKDIVMQFKKYMLRRIGSTMCKIGLTSFPLSPQVDVSLPTALWYCVEMSSYIFKDDPRYFTQECLRIYYDLAGYMIEILRYMQYDLDLEYIDKRIDLIKHVMILKKIPAWRDKVYFVVEKIFKNENGYLLSEIQNSANVYKLNYLKLDHKGILNDDVIKEKVDLNDYVHILYYLYVDTEVEICDKTFRPFFVIEENKSYYRELCKIGKKIVLRDIGDKSVLNYETIDKLDFSRILSLCNLFISYVEDYYKYPTLKEYEEYILEKKKFKDDFVIIFPVNVFEDIKFVFQLYQNAIKDVSVHEFIEVSGKYVNRLNRIKAENKKQFRSDLEILKFISKEERYTDESSIYRTIV